MSDESNADVAVAELRAAYARALFNAQAPTSGLEQQLALLGLASPAFVSARGALEAQGAHIEDWAATLRAQAERGTKSTGTPYTWAMWFAYGRELADAVAKISGETIDASRFVAAGEAAGATIQDVGSAAAAVADVGDWPLGVKLAVGAAAAVAALWVLRPYVAGLAR
jgi:hypothetical protein